MLYWGLQADPALVPDLDLVADSIRAAFDAIKDEAARLAAPPADDAAKAPPAPARSTRQASAATA